MNKAFYVQPPKLKVANILKSAYIITSTCSGWRTQRRYRKCFPQRRCLHYRTFSTIHDQLGNGTLVVSRHNAGWPQTVLTHSFEVCYILKIIQRQVHEQLSMSSVFTVVWYGMCCVNRCFILFVPVRWRPWDQMTTHLVLVCTLVSATD